MKKFITFIFCVLLSLILISCFREEKEWSQYSEIRTMPVESKILGIAGEPSAEPYIEIIFSVADEERPGYNKTASIMVSPPYIFRNDRVYMTYEHSVYCDYRGRPQLYVKTLLRDFEEGGAEYLKIINHSPDKQVEFFISGVPVISYSPNYSDILIPAIRYRNASVYFLLYPERKPAHNVFSDGLLIYFEGDRIGDLTVTEAWTVDEIAALYRAEHSYSDEVQLLLWGTDRLMDMIDGNFGDWQRGKGAVLYGIIEPGEDLRGNENIWLLALPVMFYTEFDSGGLR